MPPGQDDEAGKVSRGADGTPSSVRRSVQSGDSPRTTIAPPAPTRLAAALHSGHLAVTCDLHPPREANLDVFSREALLLSPAADAVFVTDSPGARPRVSSLAGCIRLKELGVEPVLQLTRIRSNRIALKSELLGAAAWGIYNLLLLGGDPARLGDHPDALDVYCLDTAGLIALAAGMREGDAGEGSGSTGIPFLIGAAVDHRGGSAELERARSKLEAGADFLVTQPVFDAEPFAEWWEEARVTLRGCPILAGVLVLGSARAARYLSRGLPGVEVPESAVRRLERAPDQALEGAAMAAETALSLRDLPGLAGIHFMKAAPAEGVLAAMRKAGLR
ncbi:methylenetetrahydrofolate reductase [Candidatus Solincola tengchongensis]|uniref:methylenetetrahydrofolate reductase n=1 Tax=Candidatus Solincola tengchongensis TaxID=2900693 RepID=UPI00257F5883|nr:methylenetetrahydrofolate reductase [Candidatus Solincola tengchongensis]